MASKKIIAVVGATGRQGGALVRAIVADGEFTARAITRDPSSQKAEQLKALGVEVVQADVTSAESLTKAIEGCYGLFAVTYNDFTFDADSEIAQGKAMSQAAKNAGIEHVVFTTMDDTRKVICDDRMPTIRGKYKMPPFDVKAEIEQLFIEQGLPTSFLVLCSFFDLYVKGGMSTIQKDANGNLNVTWAFPADGQVLWVAVEDIGKCALGMFKRPSEYIGKRIGIYGDILTLGQLMEKIGKAIGKPIAAISIDNDTFRKSGFPGAVEMANMFQYFYECKDALLSTHSLEVARKLNPEMMDADHWLEKYGNVIDYQE